MRVMGVHEKASHFDHAKQRRSFGSWERPATQTDELAKRKYNVTLKCPRYVGATEHASLHVLVTRVLEHVAIGLLMWVWLVHHCPRFWPTSSPNNFHIRLVLNCTSSQWRLYRWIRVWNLCSPWLLVWDGERSLEYSSWSQEHEL